VIVWDCGIYFPDEGGRRPIDDRAAAQAQVREELANGKVSVFLLGVKLKAPTRWCEPRTIRGYCFKHRDPWPVRASGSVDAERSVLTPYTVTSVSGLLPGERISYERLLPRGPAEAMPRKMSPMLAGNATAPFSDSAWSFEPKLDGYRVLAHVDCGEVALAFAQWPRPDREFPGHRRRSAAAIRAAAA